MSLLYVHFLVVQECLKTAHFKFNLDTRWDGNSMLLLRTAVILHLRQNTNLTIFTDFEDPFDLDFQQYVETEKPSVVNFDRV